jgi:hypothetical protein
MSSYNPDNIEVSDIVEVTEKSYMLGGLSGREAKLVTGASFLGRCVVLSLSKDYDWRSEPTHAMVRKIEAVNSPNWIMDGGNWPFKMALTEVKLLEKGPGTITPGVSYEFTAEETRKQRWAAYLVKLAAADQTHQGWSNAATCLARQYLVQEPAFHSWLSRNRRNDGTVNADKVKKWFGQNKLKVDDWALEPIIEPPAEFAQYSNPLRPSIDWVEIADSFSEKAMA